MREKKTKEMKKGKKKTTKIVYVCVRVSSEAKQSRCKPASINTFTCLSLDLSYINKTKTCVCVCVCVCGYLGEYIYLCACIKGGKEENAKKGN